MFSQSDMQFVRSQFPGLDPNWIYFDNAGGSQISAPALEKINDYLLTKNVQHGGSYVLSLDAAQALHEARVAAQALMNAARPEEIIFGPSSTVQLQNLAWAMRSQLAEGDEIIVTSFDHESNIGPWVRLKEFGVTIKTWDLRPGSFEPDLEDLKALLSDRTKLVCVTHASNIIGQVVDISAIARLVHQQGARLCVDAVGFAPHRAIDVQAWDVDYYVFSIYKVFGPHYSVMYGKYDYLLELDSLYHYFYGKDQVPKKLEPGNPCYELAYGTVGVVDYLAALGKRGSQAADKRELIVQAFDAITAHENALAGKLLEHLRSRDIFHIIGDAEEGNARLPIIAFHISGHDPEAFARHMDNFKIAIRWGDFHSRRLIEHMDLMKKKGVVRVSMAHYNTMEDVDRLITAIDKICN